MRWRLVDRMTRYAGRSLVDALLDRRCPGCGGAAPANREVCDACDAGVGRSGTALCLRCLHGDAETPESRRGCPRHGDERLLLAGPRFEPPLDAILHAFKYEGAHRLAPWIASLLPEPPGTRESLRREYLIAPVPLHPSRRARRGFDQTELLAAQASARWGVPFARCLSRVRDQEPQAGLAGAARRANVVEAFACTAPALVRDRPILLIDDVATTGSTLLAAAHALEAGGALWILALSAAHGGDSESAGAPADAGVA